jgi:hypothetical protein
MQAKASETNATTFMVNMCIHVILHYARVQEKTDVLSLILHDALSMIDYKENIK